MTSGLSDEIKYSAWNLTGGVFMSPAEQTVGTETVVVASGHRDEVATNGVVAAVLDLKGMMLSMIRHTILRSIHSHYDTSRQHCVVGILVQ